MLKYFTSITIFNFQSKSSSVKLYLVLLLFLEELFELLLEVISLDALVLDCGPKLKKLVPMLQRKYISYFQNSQKHTLFSTTYYITLFNPIIYLHTKIHLSTKPPIIVYEFLKCRKTCNFLKF